MMNKIVKGIVVWAVLLILYPKLNAQPSLGFMMNYPDTSNKNSLSVSSNWFRNILVKYSIIDNLTLGVGYAYLIEYFPTGPFLNVVYYRPIGDDHAIILQGSTVLNLWTPKDYYSNQNYRNYYNITSSYKFSKNKSNLAFHVGYTSTREWWYTHIFDVIDPLLKTHFSLGYLDYDDRSNELSFGLHGIQKFGKGYWSLLLEAYYTTHYFQEKKNNFNSFLPSIGFRFARPGFKMDLGGLYYFVHVPYGKIEGFSPVVKFEILILKGK